MSASESKIAAFLEQAGWPGAERSLLAADASFRRYDRVLRGRDRAVLMDAPPDREKPEAFLRVAGMLHALGLSAPGILYAAPQEGLILLEDLGDRTFTRALAEGMEEARLYSLATDCLIALHRGWKPEQAEGSELPPYDEAMQLGELGLFLDWYLPAVRGRPATQEEAAGFKQAWREALEPTRALPPTLVLRDYHVDNLMVLEGREGIAACGLLDFQDAALGCPAYDLASLLKDDRRDISPEFRETMLARYLAAFPERDPQALRRAVTLLAAQRHTKNIGIFSRLYRRDGKPGYLRHIPRLWRYLEEAFAEPALAPVRAWFDRAVLPEARRAPDSGEAA
ncbi:MAG: phosphotransferase [Rhodovibrionaceae bacterium]